MYLYVRTVCWIYEVINGYLRFYYSLHDMSNAIINFHHQYIYINIQLITNQRFYCSIKTSLEILVENKAHPINFKSTTTQNIHIIIYQTQMILRNSEKCEQLKEIYKRVTFIYLQIIRNDASCVVSLKSH